MKPKLTEPGNTWLGLKFRGAAPGGLEPCRGVTQRAIPGGLLVPPHKYRSVLGASVSHGQKSTQTLSKNNGVSDGFWMAESFRK